MVLRWAYALHGVALQSVALFAGDVNTWFARWFALKRRRILGRIMKATILFVLAFSLALPAADPSQPLFWSSSQQKDFDKLALSKLNADRHLGTERLLDSAFVAYRNGNGEAELHEKQADLLL